ncbi:MAG: MmgE/PrpD family protein [Burkholderiales bacterium]|nr:MmgE/PrpD family protein [Burkholderiales bacterium]
MDASTAKLVDYALAVRYDALPAATIAACKTRLLDSLGCVAAAYDHPLSIAARDLCVRYRVDAGATVLGSGLIAVAEMAAFANGVMVRVLDLSDMYRTKSGGHPSDTISAVLAAAELGARDGRSLISAIALAYEIYCSGCDAIDFNTKGWDQPVYGVVAAALAAGKLLGLDRERLGHAVALALVPNMAMYQTRQGELSGWKGCAGANASRNGVFAAVLAQAGFTGPEAPIEGRHGLWDVLGRFEWPLVPGEMPHRIAHTHIKCFPVCYHGQSAVWAALGMRDRVPVERIEEIRIDTHHTAFGLMASSPSRWAPASAETADHSLPYVVARALLDGKMDERSFGAEQLRDPRAAALMARTKVYEDEAMNAQVPAASPCRISVRTSDGTRVDNEVTYPKGHDRNPLALAEVETKVGVLFDGYGTPKQAQRLIETVRGLDGLDDVRRVLVDVGVGPRQ